jgi:hypothetical protein
MNQASSLARAAAAGASEAGGDETEIAFIDFDREQGAAKRTLDDVREEDANRAFVPQKQNFAPLGFDSLAQHYDAWGLQQ